MAIPQLQRNSRNGQRAADAAKILSSVNECLSNNNGILTACLPPIGGCNSGNTITSVQSNSMSWCGPITGSGNGTLDMTKLQQLTTVSMFLSSAPLNGATDTLTALVYQSATCNGSSPSSGAANQFAVVYGRESGSATPLQACLGSQ